jgi:hypothetical protein
MLVRLLKANLFYNILLVPLMGILLLVQSLRIEVPFAQTSYAVNSPILQLLINTDIPYWGTVLINYGVMLIIGFLLIHINAKFTFIKEQTFLPTYLMFFLVFALPSLHHIQPVFIAALFLMLSFYNIFVVYDKKQVIGNAFNAGFLTGLASVFYLPCLLLILIIPSSISTIKGKASAKEFFASWMGILLVWVFYFTYFFVFGKIQSFIDLFNNAFQFADRGILLKIPVIVYLSFLALVTILASGFIIIQYDTRKISTRRYFKVLAYYFFASLALFAVPSTSIELLVIVALPLTILLSNYLILMRRRFWAETFLILIIAFAYGLQYLIK